MLPLLPSSYAKLCLLIGWLWASIAGAQPLDLSTFNEGLVCQKKGASAAALHHFNQFLIQYPKRYPLAYFHRGYLYLARQEYQAALKDFERLAEYDQKTADAPYALGKTYLQLGQYEKAILHFARAIQRDPFHAAAYNDKGTALLQLRRFDLALAAFHKAIGLNPQFALAFNNLGVAYYFKQDIAQPTELDLQRARQFFSQAIQKDASLAIAYRNRGAMSMLLQAYDTALVDLRQARLLAPQDPMTYFYEGVLWADQGAKTKALAAFEKALTLQSDLPFVYEELGALHKKYQQYELAIAAYEKAKQVSIKLGKRYQGLMNYRIALVKALQGKYQAMYQFLKKARRQKVFKDRQVYQDFLNAKALSPFRQEKRFQRFAHAISKGTKDSKFLNPDLGWFRMRK